MSKGNTKFKTDKVVKLQGKEYVLFEGLLEVTHENYKLKSLETEMLQLPTNDNGNTAICKATVTVLGEKGEEKVFTGIGDASPKSVNKMIAPHIIRMSETRSLGRAMRFLTGFGTVFEELGEIEFSDGGKKSKSKQEPKKESKQDNTENKPAKASKAQVTKIEKELKAKSLSTKVLFDTLSIEAEQVSDLTKTDASKAIKFLLSDEAKNLQGQNQQEQQEQQEQGQPLDISDDDLPF